MGGFGAGFLEVALGVFLIVQFEVDLTDVAVGAGALDGEIWAAFEWCEALHQEGECFLHLGFGELDF